MKLSIKITFGIIVSLLFSLMISSGLIGRFFFEKDSIEREFWHLISFLTLFYLISLAIFPMLMNIKLISSKSLGELNKVERYGILLIFSGSIYMIFLHLLLGFLSIFVNNRDLLRITPILGFSGILIILIGFTIAFSSSKTKNENN